jgi:hypothetical protein
MLKISNINKLIITKMKKMIIALFFVAATFTGFAQSSSFDKEITPWHKLATMQCGMLKANPVNAEQILKNLDELTVQLKALSGKYLDNPPAEYAKDVNWKSYFATFAENIVVVRERVEKKQFAQASLYCSTFCKTFGQMHKINGTTDLTDLVFAWRMELKNATDMQNVGNKMGVAQTIPVVENIYKQMLVKKTLRNDKNVSEALKPLEESYASWLTAIKEGNKTSMNTAMQQFMDAFPKPYMATF